MTSGNVKHGPWSLWFMLNNAFLHKFCFFRFSFSLPKNASRRRFGESSMVICGLIVCMCVGQGLVSVWLWSFILDVRVEICFSSFNCACLYHGLKNWDICGLRWLPECEPCNQIVRTSENVSSATFWVGYKDILVFMVDRATNVSVNEWSIVIAGWSIDYHESNGDRCKKDEDGYVSECYILQKSSHVYNM